MSGYNLTKIGLIFFLVGLVLSVIAGILNYLVTEIIMINGIIAGIGGVLFLVALILMGIGGVGYKEYGEKHKKFVLIAVILFIVSIVIGVIIGIYTSFAIFSAVSESLSESEPVLSGFSALKNIFIITPISAVFSGLVYVFLLYELEDKNGKIVLYIAFILLIVTSLIIAWQGTQIFDKWILEMQPLFENIDSTSSTFGSYSEIQTLSTELQKEMGKISIWGVLPNILFVIAIIIPLNRIKKGELQKKTN